MNEILIVDYDRHILKMLRILLEAEGYGVHAAGSGPEALVMITDHPPSLIIVNYSVKGMKCAEFIEQLSLAYGDSHDVIVITNHGSEKLALESISPGAVDYLQKPFTRNTLLRVVSRLISARTEFDEKVTDTLVLAVDKKGANRSFVEKSLASIATVKTASDYLSATAFIEGSKFDLVIVYLADPYEDGLDFLRKVKVVSPSTKLVIMTDAVSPKLMREAMKIGVSDYMSRPFRPDDLRDAVSEVLRQSRKDALTALRKQLEIKENMAAVQFDATLGIVEGLIMALEARDPSTKGHSERVTDYSLLIGREMGLTRESLEIIRHSARLHDLGKIGTEDIYLYKTGSLSDEEMAIVSRHPEVACKIIRPIKLMEDFIPGIRHHHERYNGIGYPDGLKGEDIPFVARVICVADAVDAMLSVRPYRKGLSIDYVLDEIKTNRGIQFDPSVADAFLSVMERQRKLKDLDKLTMDRGLTTRIN